MIRAGFNHSAPQGAMLSLQNARKADLTPPGSMSAGNTQVNLSL